MPWAILPGKLAASMTSGVDLVVPRYRQLFLISRKRANVNVVTRTISEATTGTLRATHWSRPQWSLLRGSNRWS
ncbi:hypothetical protein BDR07DRAFT_1034616 [Suillus spraguei]|nr:hypothetical protein BDR07DRAFT_1034616 [Suillus spraguei]